MNEEIKRRSDEKAKAAFVNAHRYTDWLEQLIIAHENGDDVTIALMKLGLDMLGTIRELEMAESVADLELKVALLEIKLKEGNGVFLSTAKLDELIVDTCPPSEERKGIDADVEMCDWFLYNCQHKCEECWNKWLTD